MFCNFELNIHLNCTKLNDLMLESIKIRVYVAKKLFLTFLHSKSKKKTNDEKLYTNMKTYPIINFC